jgi:hypothetical protein
MTRVSFFRDDRGNPRVTTAEGDAGLANFLEEEAVGEERVAFLLDLVRGARDAVSDVREGGNASVLVARGGRVRVEHDYVGGPVELSSDEFATILADWDQFVRNPPEGR